MRRVRMRPRRRHRPGDGTTLPHIGFLAASLFLLTPVTSVPVRSDPGPAGPAEGAADRASASEGAPGTGARLNVLFVAVDDLNDWTGALGGHPQARTPHIDRLAKRGVLFTRAYCSAPACNPSRASLLTGLRPSTSGVYHNNQPWRRALPDAVTLPRYFMKAGYHVIGGGKIFHGRFPDAASWHEYLKRPPDPLPPGRPLSGIPKTRHFDWGPVDAADGEMGDSRVVDWALNHLRRGEGKPFFLAVGLYRPHLPWYVPRKYFKPYPPEKVTLPEVPAEDLDDVPPAGQRTARPGGDHKRVVESDNWGKAVSAYLASIAFADAMIGKLIDGLDRSPHAKNTVIVLWGDHGWHLGEKKHWRKFALWEEATRVPLIFIAPGVTRAGGRCGRTVSLLDIYPTLVELCGLPAKKELEGRSLKPLLENPSAPWDRPVLTTHGWEHHAVRSERWRYIRYADGTEELYDHRNDPMEWTNLARKPELGSVKARLAAWLPGVNVKPGPRTRRGQREGKR